MKKINDWENVKASGDFARPAAGGYVCKIVDVTDTPDKEYLHIEYDFAEGEFKNYWFETASKFGWWGGDFYRSYKDSAAGMFKAFTNAVEGSNPGYKWAWEEDTLRDKVIGLVLGEEEYVKNDGSIGTRLKVRSVKTVEDIREGRFRVPELKKLEEKDTVQDSFTAIDDAVPF